jgi:hypothetical protein
MRVMVLIKANEESEAGVLPDEQLLTAMGDYNEELVKAGVMLAGPGSVSRASSGLSSTAHSPKPRS